MEKYEHFDDLFDILHKSYIAQYQEFDETGHCYFSLEHVVSLKNEDGAKPVLQLVEAKTGKMAHIIYEESDFDYITVKNLDPIFQVNIYLKSEYQYIFYAKKL